MKKKPFLIIFLLATIILGACQPKQSTPSEKQTLVVWDQFYRDEESKVIDQLNAEFEAKHPGVSIQREVKVLEDLSLTVKLALANEDGPDVAQVNQGRVDMGALVKDGLLLSLDDYAKQYKWNERFPGTLLARNSFSEDGKQFGTGHIYGVSPTAEVVGVYYNKSIFAQHGWAVPTSFDEFLDLLAKIYEVGIVPISFGSLDGWNAIHLFSAIQHLHVSREYIDDFVYSRNDVSFDTEFNLKALYQFYDWVKLDYFTPNFQGIGYDASNESFKKGEAALTITGSWLAPELLTGTDQTFGFFLLPGYEEQQALAIGGLGIPFSIRATTEKKDLAAEYIDWMVSERAAELWADAGMVPAMPLPKKYKLQNDTLFADTVEAWQHINANNLVGHYIDWATPTMYDRLVFWLQRLLSFVSTPEEFIIGISQEYEDWKPYQQ